MRRGVDVDDETALGSDGRADPESSILSSDERLEVIVNDRLDQARRERSNVRTEQEGVPSQPLGQARDGGFRAQLRACDLAVSRASEKRRGDPREQGGPFQVVRRRERLTRAGASAVETEKTRHARRVLLAPVMAVSMEARAGMDVSAALSPGTKRRAKLGRTYALDGMSGPTHASSTRQGRRQLPGAPFRAFVVRRPILVPTTVRPRTTSIPHSRGHYGRLRIFPIMSRVAWSFGSPVIATRTPKALASSRSGTVSAV